MDSRLINAADELSRAARLGGSVNGTIEALFGQGFTTTELADLWRRERLGSMPAALAGCA